MSIQIGKYLFEGPFRNTDSLRAQSGVYVILGHSSTVETWKVVDVGESEDIRLRVASHDRKACWERHGHSTLAVAAYYCDALTRMRIEAELRRQYNPPCGVR